MDDWRCEENGMINLNETLKTVLTKMKLIACCLESSTDLREERILDHIYQEQEKTTELDFFFKKSLVVIFMAS